MNSAISRFFDTSGRTLQVQIAGHLVEREKFHDPSLCFWNQALKVLSSDNPKGLVSDAAIRSRNI